MQLAATQVPPHTILSQSQVHSQRSWHSNSNPDLYFWAGHCNQCQWIMNNTSNHLWNKTMAMTSETELMESSSSSTCFILQELFARELEHIIETIFLFLDPKSLKNSKSTCIQWKEFIDRRIWKSKTGKEELNRKLIFQWKSEKPEKWVIIKLKVHDYQKYLTVHWP